MSATTDALTDTLQHVRKSRRVSQLELSLRIGVSQRHVSFVESGRAKPSRSLLIAWLQALDAPLTVRNNALLKAGYAPAYSEASLDDPGLAEASNALTQLLKAHDPMPAFVLDAEWNILHMNQGAAWLASTLMPFLVRMPANNPLNLLDLMIEPEGFCKHIVNLREVGPHVLTHLRHAASLQPQLASKVETFAALLDARVGRGRVDHWPAPASPVLTTRFATARGELAFFSMFTTFGTPQDITLASLRVEHMFAADERTRLAVSEGVKMLPT